MNKTLLDELGGRDAIEAVVASFYERVLADPSLMHFFKNVSMSRLYQHQIDFFCAALGGSELYKGRNMVAAHAGMQITDAHFDAVAGHLIDTLKSMGVGQGHIDKVVGAVAPLRSQIVTVRTESRAKVG